MTLYRCEVCLTVYDIPGADDATITHECHSRECGGQKEHMTRVDR